MEITRRSDEDQTIKKNKEISMKCVLTGDDEVKTCTMQLEK